MNYISDCLPDIWNEFVLSHPRSHVLQLSAYGEVRKLLGWTVRRPALQNERGEIVAGFQVVIKTLKDGKRFGYIPPSGPYCRSWKDWILLWEIFVESNTESLDVLKWEPGIFLDKGAIPPFEEWGFEKCLSTVQPPRTILLDLMKNINGFNSDMDRRAKRYIKKSRESGLTYRFGDEKDAAVLSQLIVDTFIRKSMTPYSAEYYSAFYEEYKRINKVKIKVAEFEGQFVSGRMFFPVGDTIYSIWGASSIYHKDKQANYGLEWSTIEWGLSNGYKYLDFWGVPDFDKDYLDNNFNKQKGSLWGVYEFKRGFGGEVIRSEGAFEYIFRQ